MSASSQESLFRKTAIARAKDSIVPRYRSLKPWLDVPLAALMSVVSFPIIMLAMMVVRMTSKGPAIYTQKRLGLNGRPFTIYKIRTMFLNSEGTEPRWCVSGDSRVTPFGRFLRWSHIDELPQLLNILRLEMSLIGPRPERPEIVAQLEKVLPRYRERLLMHPGLTGFAQVQLPPDTSLPSVRQKLDYDLWYLERMSLWFDVTILAGTVLKCLGVSFHRIRAILPFPDLIQPQDMLTDQNELAAPNTAWQLISSLD
jgi:lipopolysaccharide/colanic/teichoic acid biosynthesis glycosyltransferase